MHLVYDAETDECLGIAHEAQIQNSDDRNTTNGVYLSGQYGVYIYTMEFIPLTILVPLSVNP